MEKTNCILNTLITIKEGINNIEGKNQSYFCIKTIQEVYFLCEVLPICLVRSSIPYCFKISTLYFKYILKYVPQIWKMFWSDISLCPVNTLVHIGKRVSTFWT